MCLQLGVYILCVADVCILQNSVIVLVKNIVSWYTPI